MKATTRPKRIPRSLLPLAYFVTQLTLLCFLPFGLAGCNRNNAKLEGSTLTAEYTLTVGEFAEQEAMNITQEIFDLAVDYKQAKRAIILLKIDKSGAKDEYGHEQSGVVQLSNPVTVNDLDELRKYKDWKTFFDKSGIGHWLPAQLKNSPAGHLLKSLR